MVNTTPAVTGFGIALLIEGLTADEAAARSGPRKGAVYWAKQQAGSALRDALREIEEAT